MTPDLELDDRWTTTTSTPQLDDYGGRWSLKLKSSSDSETSKSCRLLCDRAMNQWTGREALQQVWNCALLCDRPELHVELLPLHKWTDQTGYNWWEWKGTTESFYPVVFNQNNYRPNPDFNSTSLFWRWIYQKRYEIETRLLQITNTSDSTWPIELCQWSWPTFKIISAFFLWK